MDFLARCRLDDFLPELAHQDRTAAEFGVFAQDFKDVAPRGWGVETKEQIGRGEVEEVEHMALHHLSVMHEPAHLFRRGGQDIDAHDLVHRLGRGEVMADRADAAETLDDDRHLPQKPTVDEAFKAAEFDDVKARFLDLIVGAHVDRHLAVSFDAGDGRNLDQAGLSHARLLSVEPDVMGVEAVKPPGEQTDERVVDQHADGAQPGI